MYQTLDGHTPVAGDVLQSVSCCSRHYVFSLAGRLYVDRTSKDEDGDPVLEYGAGLIELDSLPLDGWLFAENCGDGSIEDGRAWHKRYTKEREPTPEHLADPAWRRAYCYNG